MHFEKEEFIHCVLKTKEEEKKKRTMNMKSGNPIRTEEGCEPFCAQTDGLID